MSYSKQTWQSGETITASKLNHMESGIEEALPAIDSGDAGKVLKVNAGETGAEWGSIEQTTATSYHIGMFTIPNETPSLLYAGDADVPLIIPESDFSKLYDATGTIIPSPLILSYYSSDDNKVVNVASIAQQTGPGDPQDATCYWDTDDNAITLYGMYQSGYGCILFSLSTYN